MHPTTSQDPRGVWDNSTSSRVAASLFMDDTTLLAKSEAGLAAMATTYVAYCKKFRMRVNSSKSVIMRFVNATISHEFEIETEGGVSFKSPKAKDGKIRRPLKGRCLGPHWAC